MIAAAEWASARKGSSALHSISCNGCTGIGVYRLKTEWERGWQAPGGKNVAMSLQISSAGRVCFCEYSGPITSNMVVSLLSHLKHVRSTKSESVLLLLQLDSAAARSISRGLGPFLGALPVLWDCCLEFIVVLEGGGAQNPLNRILCTRPLAQSLRCCESLDEAFSHAQSLFPHDVLELQRRRLLGKAMLIGA